MVALTIIRHNYPFSFGEHENNRLLYCYLNPDVKTTCRNTAKSDVIKIHKREKENLKYYLKSITGRFCLTSDLLCAEALLCAHDWLYGVQGISYFLSLMCSQYSLICI